MNKILAIIGPTSTGKTDVGLMLAKKFNGELLSCDSRQVYRGLDIGSGKSPGKNPKTEIRISKQKGFWEMDGVKVWMYDVADPKRRYSVWEYVGQAKKVISRIISVKKMPIIVGGTGFYFKGLIGGLKLSDKNESLRKELENLRLEEIQKKLILLSPVLFESLNDSEKKNKRRLIRKIEILESTDPSHGHRVESLESSSLGTDFDILKIGLYAPRSLLNQRIDERVDSRIKDGMIEEAWRLYNSGLSFKRMKELGLEYGMLAKLLSGEIKDVYEFRKILKIKIHQFAKRQMTWFRNQEKDVEWFDISEKDFFKKVERLTEDWYNSSRT